MNDDTWQTVRDGAKAASIMMAVMAAAIAIHSVAVMPQIF